MLAFVMPPPFRWSGIDSLKIFLACDWHQQKPACLPPHLDTVAWNVQTIVVRMAFPTKTVYMFVQLHSGGLALTTLESCTGIAFSRNKHVGHVNATPCSWSGKDNLKLLVCDELATTTVGDVYDLDRQAKLGHTFACLCISSAAATSGMSTPFHPDGVG